MTATVIVFCRKRSTTLPRIASIIGLQVLNSSRYRGYSYEVKSLLRLGSTNFGETRDLAVWHCQSSGREED
jgi:hypothetical protein